MHIYRVQLKDKDPANKCCICGKDFDGYGNNPAPVKNEGRCCDKCNIEKVIPARIEMFTARRTDDAVDMIDTLIASEEQAIREYSKAIDETESEDRTKVYLHILEEEKDHLRELKELKEGKIPNLEG